MGLLTGFDMAYAANYIEALPIASYNASSNGSGVDISGYAEPVIAVLYRYKNTAGANPTFAISFEHSEDNTTFAAVPAAALTDADGAAATFSAAGTTAGVQKLALRKQLLKKYLRVVYTIGGTSSPAFLANVVLAGAKRRID